MTKQTINIGAAPNDGTGDPIRTAFDKTNDNFDEIYSGLAVDAGARNVNIPSAVLQSARGLPRLRKVLADVASGTRKHLTELVIGDSLAATVQGYLEVDHLINFFPTPTLVNTKPSPAVGGTPGRGIGGAACELFGGSTGTRAIKTDYTVSWTGSYFNIAAGQYVELSRNAVFNVEDVDKIIIPMITETGAGAVKIEIVDDATKRDLLVGEIASDHALTGGELIVDCNAALGLDIVELEFDPPLASCRISVTHESGGTVRMLGPQYLTTSLFAGCINYYRLSEGSNSFDSINSLSDALTGQLIGALQPDLITIHCNDTAASMTQITESLASALSTAGLAYKPFVLGIGNGPSAGAEDYAAAHNVALATGCAKYNFGFFSMMDVFPTYSDLTEMGWGGDGTHMNTAAYQWVAAEVAEKLRIHKRDGLATDPVGFREIAKLPAYPLEIRNFVTANQHVVGSATFAEAGPQWTFAAGATANSKLTRRGNNDFLNPFIFRTNNYQQNYAIPLQFNFAARMAVQNAEGQFWLVVGTDDFNSDAAQDLAEKGWAFKLENGTPVLQLHDGATLSEHSAGTAHLTDGVAGNLWWKYYRIIQMGNGQFVVYQDNVLIGIYSGGPTGTTVYGAGVRAAIANGPTAENYSVVITPPVIHQLY